MSKEMRILKKAIKITSLTLFLALFSGVGLAQSPSEDTNAMAISLRLREWFVLEVQTSEETMTADGESGASISATLSPDGQPVRIRALASVPRTQTVELRVQAFGNLVNPQGETLELTEVGWEGSGEGFLSGRFSNSGSAVMARWTGPGSHEGFVRYVSLKKGGNRGDFTQKIVYSLMAT